jgi:hypothetical protein
MSVRTFSDPDGNYTFCNKNGSSTIDLSLCSNEFVPLLDFKVLEEIEALHFPIMTTIEGRQKYWRQLKLEK